MVSRQVKDNLETVIIPELEEMIEMANHAWATDEVKQSIKKYWGAKGTNRQKVHECICKHHGIDGVSFNQMRYFVNTYMRDEMGDSQEEE